MDTREEIRQRVKKLLDDPQYQETDKKAPVHEIPDMSKDDTPPKGWKQDETGRWVAPGWKKVGDTYVIENEDEEEED